MSRQETASLDRRAEVAVVICTRNRAESLRATLQSRAAAETDGIGVEIIVVDNGSQDLTRTIVRSFEDILRIRVVDEAKPGKCHALNSGVGQAQGNIVAVLDDDMTVAGDWVRAIVDVCRRHPDRELFGGTIEIEWPAGTVPAWATHAGLRGEIFSAETLTAEADLDPDRWFSGNHFWFRSSVLDLGVRFDELWVTEGKFQLDLVEKGVRGMSAPAVVARHRVQSGLLQPDAVLGRARRAGIAFARLRLEPYRACGRRARLMHRHPLLSRAYCLARHLYYRARYAVACLYSTDADQFAERVVAAMWMTSTAECLRIARRHDEYALWKRNPSPGIA